MVTRPSTSTLFAAWLLAACSDPAAPSPDAGPPPPPPRPQPPRARITAPSTGRVNTPIRLDGSSSAPSVADFRWSVVEAPEGAHLLADSDQPIATLTPRAPGRFVVELAVRSGSSTASARARLDVECPEPEVPASVGAGEDLVLVDRSPGGCVDYRSSTDLGVGPGSRAVIEPGVRLEMGPGTVIRVDRGGELTIGEDPRLGRVELSGADPRPGSWGGLQVSDGTLRLTSVDLRHAGAGGAAVSTSGAARLGVRDLAVLQTSGRGLALGERTELFDYGDNRFGAELDAAVELPLSLLPDLRAGQDRHDGEAPYRVRGDFLNRPFTLPATGVAWRFAGGPGAGRLVWTADVLVEPGAVLELDPGVGLELAFGHFVLRGSSDAPVELSGTGAGGWSGLLVSRGARAELEQVRFQGAGLSGGGYAPAPGPASLTATSTAGQARATALSLRAVEILDGPGLSIWAEPSVEYSCEDVATSGQVAPACGR